MEYVQSVEVKEMRIEGNFIPLKVTHPKHISNSFEKVFNEVLESQDSFTYPTPKHSTSKVDIDRTILREVDRVSQKYGVPKELILAIIQQESGFNPLAYNRNKDGTEDRGLMQVNYQHNISLMKEYNIVDPNQLYDIATNIEIGTRILYENYKTFKNWVLAVKAYNGLKANNWDYVRSVFEKVSLFR